MSLDSSQHLISCAGFVARRLAQRVMEAMCAGCRSSLLGRRHERTDRRQQTGYLTPPADSAALADRILFALGDEVHREGIVSAARRRITSHSEIERMVESVEALYDEIM